MGVGELLGMRRDVAIALGGGMGVVGSFWGIPQVFSGKFIHLMIKYLSVVEPLYC